MRFLIAALAFAATESALAHSLDDGFLSNFGHQLTSLHHPSALIMLTVLVVGLVLLARRNRTVR